MPAVVCLPETRLVSYGEREETRREGAVLATFGQPPQFGHMADPKGQVAMGTVYPPQQAVPGPQPMAVPYGQPMMAQPMQPVAVAQAMPVQQVAVAQPMPVQPVAAAPMGFGDPGRPPPPGAPPGGQYRHVQYVGIITCAGGLKRRCLQHPRRAAHVSHRPWSWGCLGTDMPTDSPSGGSDALGCTAAKLLIVPLSFRRR